MGCFAYAASLPQNTKAFISTALGWNHLLNPSGSETIDKVKALVKTIFCIATVWMPLLFLKGCQITYLNEEAQGKEWLKTAEEKLTPKEKIDYYTNIFGHFLKYGHFELAVMALNKLCLLLDTDKKNSEELETIRIKLVGKIPTNLNQSQRTQIENELETIRAKAAENIVVF
jgi:hypothetical protein